ncbi:hypothetical protein H4F99_09490 [Lysobacter sp. SG-8]|uniref:Thioredoxin-like fold domain-containing protein n=1 Tax=Marilutibacter penaei TaxID=2759900 RepID=A0A7W3U4C3_9GAMM|nr:hypothetical protein [Lysobacter penaei]MBB1088722.1 hypothetical protein [Lysobacter penaei]
MKTCLELVRAVLLAGLLSIPWAADAQVRQYRPLPDDAWRTLEAASGIRWMGASGLQANVQVICDANCPYCARLDRTLREKYPSLAVRWVPTAYFQRDSEAVAASLLSSEDPVAALIANYRDYDFDARHGGHVPASNGLRLGASHGALEQAWKEWGGFTPMIVVRTRDGRILQALGSNESFVAPVLEMAAPSARRYEAWGGTP